MGKKAVWCIVKQLMSSNQVPIEDEDPRVGLDITDGKVLRWWLWICNLGVNSTEVIGVGVIGAKVSIMDRGHSATFTFYRVDGTSSRVVLTLGGKVSIYV